jgi:hypothetical protein
VGTCRVTLDGWPGMTWQNRLCPGQNGVLSSAPARTRPGMESQPRIWSTASRALAGRAT